MLDMGFLPDIKRVLKHIPKAQQTLFFSATMPAPIAQLSKELLNNPVTFNVERKSMPASGVTQTLFPVSQDSKPGLLLSLLETEEVGVAIVFTRTKHRANKVAKFLVSKGIEAERIHGDRSQGQRTEALAGFKSGKYRVLVATDIAARGIDIDALEHVINFDVPHVPDDYIHRVGRTARAEAHRRGPNVRRAGRRTDDPRHRKSHWQQIAAPKIAGLQLRRCARTCRAKDHARAEPTTASQQCPPARPTSQPTCQLLEPIKYQLRRLE